MKLFDLLKIYNAEIAPEQCKTHLARYNGNENPLDVYLSGTFESWQSWQTKKNFNRSFIISLVQLPGKNKWLFVGVYQSISHKKHEKNYQYETEELSEFSELAGRVVLEFERTGRQSYLNTERWEHSFSVVELLPEKMVVGEFKGYNKTLIKKSVLDLIVSQKLKTWRAALSNVAGIYLITDRHTGKLYVGSATGDSGIWQRWCSYSENGHGGNKELKALLSECGDKYSNNFQYSILEISDSHASKEDTLARELYWKTVLCSKEHGYNAN